MASTYIYIWNFFLRFHSSQSRVGLTNQIFKTINFIQENYILAGFGELALAVMGKIITFW